MSQERPSPFEHLRDLEPEEKAVYEFYMLDGSPTIEVRPAAERNKGYYNALLAKSKKSMRRLRTGKLSVDTLRNNRDEDRELYPKHVLAGRFIKPPQSRDGKVIEHYDGIVADLISHLPDWAFDDLRNFCADLSNFLPDDHVDEEEVEDLKGN